MKETCLYGVRFGLGENGLQRLAGIAKLGETGADGESQELVRFQQSANGKAFEIPLLHERDEQTFPEIGHGPGTSTAGRGPLVIDDSR